MPGIKQVLRRFTKQFLVYWQKVGTDGYGRPTYADPVEIKCRWEDEQKEILTAEGRTVRASGLVLIGSYLAPGSLVRLGKLTDWQAISSTTIPTDPAYPTRAQGGREVLACNSTPDIGAKDTIYEVYL